LPNKIYQFLIFVIFIFSFQLSALEILAENLSGEISSKEEDFGRAGTVRAEFNQDMEEVQLWLQT